MAAQQLFSYSIGCWFLRKVDHLNLSLVLYCQLIHISSSGGNAQYKVLRHFERMGRTLIFFTPFFINSPFASSRSTVAPVKCIYLKRFHALVESVRNLSKRQ
jgi:hypothetical protein